MTVGLSALLVTRSSMGLQDIAPVQSNLSPADSSGGIGGNSWMDLMMTSDPVAWLSLAVSAVALLFTAWTYVDRRRAERELHVSRCTVSLQVDEPSEYDFVPRRSVLVRNDGPSSVTLESLALAYGERFAVDRNSPSRWTLDPVPMAHLPHRLLPPGGSVEVEAPDDLAFGHLGILGPAARLVDCNGVVWQRTTWGWRMLHESGMPSYRRRDMWFERQRWWEPVNGWLLRSGTAKARRRPSRLPWQIRFVHALWGYRPGPVSVERLPWGAPAPWGYDELLEPVDLAEPSTVLARDVESERT